MATKPLKFSIHQLVIPDEAPFTVNTFSLIDESELETFNINRSEEEQETLSIKRVSKEVRENRFICLYFNEGDKFPYSPTVIDTADLQEKENPRSPEDIEMSDQFFVVIDVLHQRLYLSDQRRKGTFLAWLKDKLSKEVNIKSIIDEETFLDKINSVSRVSFAILPNLFNSSSQDALSDHIVTDIYGFGAEKARLDLEYRNASITDNLKNKLASIMKQRVQFKEITIIGRSDEGFESVFNLEEVINKITVDVSLQEKTNLLDCSIVFSLLTDKIKNT